MTVNIYSCTIDNGEDHDCFAQTFMVQYGKNKREARKLVLERLDEQGCGTEWLNQGGTLLINLEYKNVIINQKP